MANNYLRSIERKYQDLKREEAAINDKNLNATSTFQSLRTDTKTVLKLKD